MDCYDEIVCMNALNRIFGFAPSKAIALIDYFGSAKALFANKDLKKSMPYIAGIDKICDKEYESSEKELESQLQEDITFIHFRQNAYPRLLLECPDFPIGLYIKSTTPVTELFSNESLLAIVGTRDLSPYGKEWTNKIIHSLSKTDRPPCIVSGLALGTDIIAHRAALEHQMKTIAILPTGIDSIYPARHIGDAEKIVNTPGCALITDYPPQTTPYPVNFIRRNRIIAGLCKRTIVTESKIKGGAMITANLAFSYDRDVYTLPGRTSDPKSAGCNYLIKSKMAEPIISIESLMEQLELRIVKDDITNIRQNISQSRPDLIEIMSKVLLVIKENPGIDIENIRATLGLKTSEVIQATSLLETDGLISIDMLRRCIIQK